MKTKTKRISSKPITSIKTGDVIFIKEIDLDSNLRIKIENGVMYVKPPLKVKK